MKNSRIAIPSQKPGGLDSQRSEHFGHCELFTLVEVEGGEIVLVETLENVSHGAGGCMKPVGLLRDNGVDTVVVAGIGAGPLRGFADAGITVFIAAQQPFQDVRSVVDGILGSRLTLMDPALACKGHGNCHG